MGQAGIERGTKILSERVNIGLHVSWRLVGLQGARYEMSHVPLSQGLLGFLIILES